MNITFANMLLFIKIVVVFSFLIGGIYGFVIPTYFSDYKTYSILILGVAVAALLGGYVGYQHLPTAVLWKKLGIGVLAASVVGCLVGFLSLLIILNVRGS